MKLLLLSNSANKGEGYLEYPKKEICDFLGSRARKVIFLPYAGVTVGFDEYEMVVADKFRDMGYELVSLHRFKDPVDAIKQAEAIATGGGNTYMLLHRLQQLKLIGPIRKKILAGTPYVGWSAGANIVCPTIMTTNDMPVVWPKTLNALNLVPFQINPHFIETVPDGFAGETREMRLREFIEVNQGTRVVGLREGTMLKIEGRNMALIGNKKARVYVYGKEPVELSSGNDMNFLLS